MLACDLLVAGGNGDAVVALAAESARTLPTHDANRRLAAVTAELGLAEPDLATAVELIAADTCERILDRSIPAEVGTHRLYVVGHEGSPLNELLTAGCRTGRAPGRRARWTRRQRPANPTRRPGPDHPEPPDARVGTSTPTDKLTALRLGRRLVTEVAASQPRGLDPG